MYEQIAPHASHSEHLRTIAQAEFAAAAGLISATDQSFFRRAFPVIARTVARLRPIPLPTRTEVPEQYTASAPMYW